MRHVAFEIVESANWGAVEASMEMWFTTGVRSVDKMERDMKIWMRTRGYDWPTYAVIKNHEEKWTGERVRGIVFPTDMGYTTTVSSNEAWPSAWVRSDKLRAPNTPLYTTTNTRHVDTGEDGVEKRVVYVNGDGPDRVGNGRDRVKTGDEDRVIDERGGRVEQKYESEYGAGDSMMERIDEVRGGVQHMSKTMATIIAEVIRSSSSVERDIKTLRMLMTVGRKDQVQNTEMAGGEEKTRKRRQKVVNDYVREYAERRNSDARDEETVFQHDTRLQETVFQHQENRDRSRWDRTVFMTTDRWDRVEILFEEIARLSSEIEDRQELAKRVYGKCMRWEFQTTRSREGHHLQNDDYMALTGGMEATKQNSIEGVEQRLVDEARRIVENERNH